MLLSSSRLDMEMERNFRLGGDDWICGVGKRREEMNSTVGLGPEPIIATVISCLRELGYRVYPLRQFPGEHYSMTC